MSYEINGLVWTVLVLVVGPTFYYLDRRATRSNKSLRAELVQAKAEQSEVSTQLNDIRIRIESIEKVLRTVD